MNHQPFEAWLLEPAKLDAKQKSELQAHLKSCTDCTALAEVDLALHSARMAAPQEGFSERFQVLLAERKAREQRRNIWGFVLLGAAVSAGLVWLAWPVLAAVAASPVNTLAGWLSTLLALWTSIQAIGHVSELLFKTLPGFVPPVAWMLILLVASGWGVVWILSMMKFVKIPQGA